MKVQCAVKGCVSVYTSDETAAPNVKYVCSNHIREEQLAAVGRTYTPNTDDADSEARFQEHAFDKDLKTRINNRQPFTGKLPERPEMPKSSLSTEGE